MSISVSYYRDRTGEIYKDYFDQEVEFFPVVAIAEDITIQKALNRISEP